MAFFGERLQARSGERVKASIDAMHIPRLTLSLHILITNRRFRKTVMTSRLPRARTMQRLFFVSGRSHCRHSFHGFLRASRAVVTDSLNSPRRTIEQRSDRTTVKAYLEYFSISLSSLAHASLAQVDRAATYGALPWKTGELRTGISRDVLVSNYFPESSILLTIT